MGSKSSSSTSSTSSQVSTTSNVSADEVQKAVVLSNVEAQNITVTDAGAVSSAFEFASEMQEGSADLIEKSIYAGQQQVTALGNAVKKVLETDRTDGATAVTGTLERFGLGFLLMGGAGIIWAWRSKRV